MFPDIIADDIANRLDHLHLTEHFTRCFALWPKETLQVTVLLMAVPRQRAALQQAGGGRRFSHINPGCMFT